MMLLSRNISIARQSSIARVGLISLGMLMLCTMTGCLGVELGTMKPGKMEWVAPITTADAQPRVGHAYLIRGLIGLFSYGIDRMTDKVNAAGVTANVFQEDQTAELGKTIVAAYKAHRYDHEPIVLMGHSLGADDAIKISKMLEAENIPVDLLITVDATNPPAVPGNVKLCYNYYQPNFFFDNTGMLRGIPLVLEPGAKTVLYNYNIRGNRTDLLEWDTNHVNIDKNTKIHADVVKHVLEICPTREVWAAMHGQTYTRPAESVKLVAPTTQQSSQQSAQFTPGPTASKMSTAGAGGM